MKKFKKTFWVIIIIGTILISICSNISMGTSTDESEEVNFHDLFAEAPTGSKYVLDGGDVIFRYWNTFCIEYDQELEDVAELEYDVKYKVEIRGEEAKFYEPDGTLIGTTSFAGNNYMAALLTPNEYVDPSICEQYRTDEDWGTTGVYNSYTEASYSLDGYYPKGSFSSSQLGVWYEFDDWVELTESNGVTLDFVFNGTDEVLSWENHRGIDGLLAYANSLMVGMHVELNVDIFILHHDDQQNLLLVIPYGENLPEEEPDSGTDTDTDSDVTNITVTKKWEDEDNRDGLRPDTITVTLYADGVASQTATFGGTGNEWTHQFTNVPINNSDGTTIAYTIQEVAIDGYESTQESVYKTE